MFKSQTFQPIPSGTSANIWVVSLYGINLKVSTILLTELSRVATSRIEDSPK